MTRHLFRFGFESPEDRRANETHNSDFESSTAIWIEASSEADALSWGQQIAEAFVEHLFLDAPELSYFWTEVGFAYWIEQEPPEALDALPSVAFGEMPDLNALR